ncbi:MAG: levansucrase [Pelagibacterium sp. SCN 63-23]|nr:MAG: levansucrase [Pelagibacterium sp. SCN 63-23]
MALALKDKWIWDFWTYRDGDDYHIYFLQADNTLDHPDMRHRNVTQGHAVSKDLINWTHLGTTFKPADPVAWDDWTTWTGSTLRDDKGLWHLFYTGTEHAEEGMKQRIGHATSTDGHNWTRVGNGLALDISGPDYEEYTPGHWHDRAFRDPWVMKNPKGDGWVMYMVARRPGTEEPNAGGTVGFATSPDLYTWTLQPPVYSGGMFGQMEVPQVFEVNGKWYMLFCTDGSHWSDAYKAFNPEKPVRGTHYLMADDPFGPWDVAPGPFFDGAQGSRYAGKIVETDNGLVFMGFLHDAADGSFIGQVSDPIPVRVDADGLLHAELDKLPPGAKV